MSRVALAEQSQPLGFKKKKKTKVKRGVKCFDCLRRIRFHRVSSGEEGFLPLQSLVAITRSGIVTLEGIQQSRD